MTSPEVVSAIHNDDVTGNRTLTSPEVVSAIDAGDVADRDVVDVVDVIWCRRRHVAVHQNLTINDKYDLQLSGL